MAKHPGVSIAVGVMPHLRPVSDPDAPEPDSDDQDGAPDDDSDDEGDAEQWNMKPEWVDYASEASNCKNCQAMQDDGTCSKLHISVGPEDHCKAFAPKETQGPEAPEETNGTHA
jgi:hypothetical protein